MSGVNNAVTFYMNTRHRLPQISIHQTWSRVDRAAVVPARVSTNNEFPQSNKGATQAVVEIDNYPSRRSIGMKNMTDYTRDLGQKGLSDAQSATSKRTQRAWSFIENGAKRGNDIPQKYKSDAMAKYQQAQMKANFHLMAGPNFRVTPSQVVGESDLGDLTTDVQTTPFADVQITPGKAETQIADGGFIRHWVSEGHYDIYA